MNKWKNEIQSLYNTSITQKLNIYGFLKYSKVINHLEIRNQENNTIKKAIESAKIYIENQQEQNGSWEDYLNDAGVSNI